MKPLTPAERGRLGGQATVERHGLGHMRAIAARGGQAVVERHGAEHMSAIGKAGFEATVERVFGGDREAAIRRWIKVGLRSQDPFPENGAWQQRDEMK